MFKVSNLFCMLHRLKHNLPIILTKHICLPYSYFPVIRIPNPYMEGILPKGPYPPCLRMADRALLAGYSRYLVYGCPYELIEPTQVALSRQSVQLYQHIRARNGRIGNDGCKWVPYGIPLASNVSKTTTESPAKEITHLLYWWLWHVKHFMLVHVYVCHHA